MTSAIYFQKSQVVQEEFKLIEVATLREMVVEKLQRIIRQVKERRRECDEATILETFSLFNKARDATVDVIRSISVWQESFTKPIRPRLLDCDYIVDRLIGHIDFINSTNLKRMFNFQFYRGNVLLLPYPNPDSTVDPVRISTALERELRAFAAPAEQTVLYCYQFLINCLPDEVYQDKLAPLKRWLMAGWIPKVVVINSKPKKPTLLQKQNSKRTELLSESKTSERRRSSAGGNSSSIKHIAPSQDAGNAQGDSSEQQQGRRRRSTLGSKHSSSNNNKGCSNSSGGNGQNQQQQAFPSTQRGVSAGKSRIRQRQQQQLEVDASLGAEGQDSNTAQQTDYVPTLEAADDVETTHASFENHLSQQSPVRGGAEDAYFEEMELLFLPVLGRRAVQTVVVGGARVESNEEYQEPITHELFHKPERIVFHHTAAAWTDQDDEGGVLPLQGSAIQAPMGPEGSRTSADLMAKRNRILADRSQLVGEQPRYERHSKQQAALVDFSSYKRPFDRSTLLSTRQAHNPIEILFAANDNTAESSKAAATYLKNKYNTTQVRRQSADFTADEEGSGGKKTRALSFASYGTSTKASQSGVSRVRSQSEASELSQQDAEAEVPRKARGISEVTFDCSVQSEDPDSIPPPPPLSPEHTPLIPVSATTTPSGKSKSPSRGRRKRADASYSPPQQHPVSILRTPPLSAGRRRLPSHEAGQEQQLGEEEQSGLREFDRRGSRRMSDLTITFSLGEAAGMTGEDAFSIGEEANGPVALPKAFGSKSPLATKPSGMGPVTPKPGGNSTPAVRKQPSPSRSPSFKSTHTSVSAKSAAGDDVQSQRPSSSRRGSRASTPTGAKTNEYGVKVRAGTPPRASASLTLSTDAMRLLFAQLGDGDGALH